jgi:hypothetical protein
VWRRDRLQAQGKQYARRAGGPLLRAECKFYNRPNSMRDAADQLLPYSGWRDRDLCLLTSSEALR